MFDIIILNLKCTNMISAIIRWPPKNNLVEEIIYFLKSSFFFYHFKGYRPPKIWTTEKVKSTFIDWQWIILYASGAVY